MGFLTKILILLGQGNLTIEYFYKHKLPRIHELFKLALSALSFLTLIFNKSIYC